MGGKLCRFFYLPPNDMNSLLQKTSSPKVTSSTLGEDYPYLLPEEKLNILPKSTPELILVKCMSDGNAVVYASIREMKIKEELPLNEINNHFSDSLKHQFAEAYGVRNERRETFTIFWIPKTKDIIEIRSDHPKGMNTADTQNEIRLACKAFEKDFSIKMPSPINVFPLIEDLYNNKSEGKVVELAFGTTTRSLKHEKMRGRGDCLREELFHLGGKNNLSQPIKPYKIGIAYSVEISGNIYTTPELSIDSSIHMADALQPYHCDILISKNIGKKDYEHIRGRIFKYI